MLTIEPRVVNKSCARSHISFKHMSFWCPFLDPHLTGHHPNIGVRFRQVTELGLLPLLMNVINVYFVVLQIARSLVVGTDAVQAALDKVLCWVSLHLISFRIRF